MNRKLIARYFIRETLGLVVMGVALFWSAGRIDWWAAWAALAVMLAWTARHRHRHPALQPRPAGRAPGAAPGAKSWDTAILSLLGLTQLARLIVAGLDQRYGWTGGLTVSVQMAAFIVCALGYALVVWATASNAFFSQIVRIQSERDHSGRCGRPVPLCAPPGLPGRDLV